MKAFSKKLMGIAIAFLLIGLPITLLFLFFDILKNPEPSRASAIWLRTLYERLTASPGEGDLQYKEKTISASAGAAPNTVFATNSRGVSWFLWYRKEGRQAPSGALFSRETESMTEGGPILEFSPDGEAREEQEKGEDENGAKSPEASLEQRAGADPGGESSGKGSDKKPSPADKSKDPVAEYDNHASNLVSKPRAQRAPPKKPQDLTGANHYTLWKVNKDADHAVRMGQVQFLLDGVKDFAGKQFDGNFKIYKAIPLERYDHTLQEQALRKRSNEPPASKPDLGQGP